MSNKKSGIRVFYSYSHKDERFREQLEEHLAIFRRAGLIQEWSDRKIVPGNDWRLSIDSNLEKADLILLLVSSSFIASDYCYDKELGLAMSKHESGMVRVIPIFVRPAEWKDAPFSGIQGLPENAVPVTQWENEDVAWQNIASGLRTVLDEMREQRERPVARDSMKTLQAALTENVEQIDELYNRDDLSEIVGIPTGFVDFDRIVKGLHKGELFVIAARPAMGKTTFALNIASTVSAKANLPVLIFSTKMPARDVSRRIMTSISRIEYGRLASGLLVDDDWPKLTRAIQTLNDTNVLIDDSAMITLSDLRERCWREKNRLGALALVVIDSAQYLRADTNQTKEPEGIGSFLKLLARELDTTILLTSQISRDVEYRVNKRPLLRDLDKVAGVVDEADVVTFIYIDSHYNPDSLDRGTAELIIAKNQFGPVGVIRVTHFIEYGAFHNYGGVPEPS